jgi:perosamine synthetase
MRRLIPYGRQAIDEEDIDAVVKVLRSDWLTTGPKIEEFERAICAFTSAKKGVAVSNGTAALHTAIAAAGIGPGDEVLVTPMTFAASANCIVYQGGKPVFVDVDPDTLLIDPNQVRSKITKATKAIVSVDYAGNPCPYDELNEIAHEKDLILISDACHALGAEYKGKKIGALADLTALSFHPVKHITTGEGGMVLTENDEFEENMRRFRNHGIDRTARQREADQTWFYEMTELGYNYRLTDIQCALGISQLRKLPRWLERRREIAAVYLQEFKDIKGIRTLGVTSGCKHAYHLFVIEIEGGSINRNKMFVGLRKLGIGVNVHYIPVHLHAYYVTTFGTGTGLCPKAEEAYGKILSIPIFGTMTDGQVNQVIEAIRKCLRDIF